jgi:hypothetical protein
VYAGSSSQLAFRISFGDYGVYHPVSLASVPLKTRNDSIGHSCTPYLVNIFSHYFSHYFLFIFIFIFIFILGFTLFLS